MKAAVIPARGGASEFREKTSVNLPGNR